MKRILSTLLMTMLMSMTTAMAEELRVAETILDLTKDYSNVSTGLSSGSYSYNHNTKELVLNNVTLTSTSGEGKLTGIYSSVAGLTIRFKGTNAITTKYEGLYLDANTNLVNEGKVGITSNTYEAIYIRNTTTLNFYYGVWDLKGKSGIKGKDKNQTVNIYNDTSKSLTLIANGTEGCIWNLKGLNLDNVGLLYGYFTNNAVCTYNIDNEPIIIKGKDVVIGIRAFILGGQSYATGQITITGSNITGSVTYNHSSKTLKMVDAEVNGTFVPYLDDMTLISTGTNTIYDKTPNADGYLSIQLININNLTIRGSGTLNTGPIEFDYTDEYPTPNLTIQDGVTVNITNNIDLIPGIYVYGYNPRYGKLTIKNSTLNINVKPKAECIICLTSLDGSIIKSPLQTVHLYKDRANYYSPIYDNSYGLFYNLDCETYIKGNLSIEPGTAYGVWVNGVQVNSANKGNLNSALSGGSCNYNPSTKTLSLNNAIITYKDNKDYRYPAIYNKISGLVIKNTGTSEIGGDIIGIESEADFAITGSGHLKVTGTGTAYGAININDYTLTVNNMELTATGGKYAIFGSSNSDKGTVSLNDSYLHLTCNSDIDYSSAVRVTFFEPNCIITYPVNGIFRYGAIREADGTTLAKKVEIEPKKGIVTTIDAVTPIEEVGETNIYTPSGIWYGRVQDSLNCPAASI